MSKFYYYILCIFIFITPQYSKASADQISILYDSLSYIFLIASLIQIFHLFLNEKIFNLIKDNKATWLFVFMFISGASFFWSQANDPKEHLYLIIKIIIVIIPLCFLEIGEKELSTLLKIYLIGTILGSLQVIYNYYFNAEFYYGIKRSYITGIDSNESAILLAIGYCLTLFYYYRSKNLLILLAAIPQIAAVFYTGSRTGFIAIIICSLMALYLFDFLKLKFSSLLIVVALAGGFFVLQMVLPAENMNRIFNTGEDLSTGEMSGRKEIWEHAFLLIPQKIVSGYGMNSFADTIEKSFMRFNAHNVFIKAQFEVGIIGLIPLLLWLISSFIKILKNHSVFKPLIITLFIVIVVSFMQLSWIYSTNLLVLILLIINIAELKETETDTDTEVSAFEIMER